MRRVFYCLLVVFIGITCGAGAMETETVFDEMPEGTKYDSLSERFTIIVYPTLVQTNGERAEIHYNVSVDNKSEQAYKDVCLTIRLNPALDQYIAAGVLPLPFSKVDLAAKSVIELADGEGKGIDINFSQLLSDAEFLREAGLGEGAIFDLGRDFELWIQWNGGEEKHALSAPVIDVR